MNLNEIYRNPTWYYIFIPLLVALWPLLIWAVYLPDADTSFQKEKAQYDKAQTVIEQILTLDPDRLIYAQARTAGEQFDYATAVQKVANQVDVQPAKYKLTSSMVITSAGQKSQSARVSLKDVQVVQFAQFLSTIQLQWPNLQCGRVKLTKRKASPDSWDVDIDFKYYF